MWMHVTKYTRRLKAKPKTLRAQYNVIYAKKNKVEWGVIHGIYCSENFVEMEKVGHLNLFIRQSNLMPRVEI